MDELFEYTITDEERAARRATRTAARLERQRKERQRLIRKLTIVGGACLALLLCVLLIGGIVKSIASRGAQENPTTDTTPITAEKPDVNAQQTPPPVEEEPDLPELPFSLVADDRTVTIGDELSSKYAIVIDLTGEVILAQKAADTVISPASMTKILTILVAAEHISPEDLDDTFVIDLAITDYCYINECSVAGFNRGEAVTVRNLFYGTILPSGADGALGLATYVAGSQEEFVRLMNEKVAELGLSETARFANCVGLYDKQNVCTVYDMAMILRAAMENELCREILTTKIHQIPASDEHPEGMTLSNWFLRRIEDYVPEGLEVIGAKTGYVSQAGNCAASIAQTEDGNFYICVTGNTSSSKQCVQDHVQLYTTFLGY